MAEARGFTLCLVKYLIVRFMAADEKLKVHMSIPIMQERFTLLSSSIKNIAWVPQLNL